MNKIARTRKKPLPRATQNAKRKTHKKSKALQLSRIFLTLIIFLILITLPLSLLLTHNKTSGKRVKVVTKEHAQKERVTNEKKKIFKLVQQENPRLALKTLEKNMREDTVILRSCHPIVHELGRMAYRKYRDFATVMQYRDETCGSGYIHGAVEAKFTFANDIVAELHSTCSPYDGSCLHGMGHGLMFFTKNDLPRALALCETLPTPRQKGFCAEGVYMENFNTDQKMHISKYLNPKDPFYPCNDQAFSYKSTCYFYAPLYYLTLHEFNAVKALSWCETADKAYQANCANGVGSRTMKVYVDTPKTVERFCMSARDILSSSCIDGMMGYYMVHNFSASKAELLCNTLEHSNKPTCFRAVAARRHLFPS